MDGVNTLQDLDKFLASPIGKQPEKQAFGPPPVPIQAKKPLPAEFKNVQDLDTFLKSPIQQYDLTPVQKIKEAKERAAQHPEELSIGAGPNRTTLERTMDRIGDVKVAGDLTLRQAWKNSEAPLGDQGYQQRYDERYQKFLKEHAGAPLMSMASLEALGFGLEHAATGLFSPQNMLLLAGMGAMNPKSILKPLIDAGFSSQMAMGFIQNSRAGVDAFRRGDALSGITAFTDASVSLGFAYLSGKAAVDDVQVRSRAMRMREYAVGKLDELSKSKYNRPWSQLSPHEQAEITYSLATSQNAPLTSATARRMGAQVPSEQREEFYRKAETAAGGLARGTAAAREAVPPTTLPPPPEPPAPLPFEPTEKQPYRPVTGGAELPDNDSMYMTPEERSQRYYTIEEARKRLDEERRIAAQEQETRKTAESELERIARERREQAEGETAYRETRAGRRLVVQERRGLQFDEATAEANRQEHARLTGEMDRIANEHMYYDAQDMLQSIDTEKARGRELEDWKKNVFALESRRRELLRLSNPEVLEPTRTEAFRGAAEDMALGKRETAMREAAAKIEAEAKKQTDADEFEKMSAEAEEAKKRAEDIRTERDKKEAERIAATADREEYPLGPVMDMVKGVAGQIILPDGRKVPFHYAVVPQDAVISSHDPFNNFEPNPKAIAVSQGRDYKNNRESQSATIARGKNPEMDLLINTSPTAETGPPIVRSDGQALGGRNRVNIWKLLYKNGFDDLAYQAMTGRARELGVTAEQVANYYTSGRQPMVVRVLDDPFTSAKDLAQLGRDLDRTQTMGFSEAEEAVMAGRGISEKTLDWLSGQLDAMGDDATLRDLMRYRGGEVVERMLDSGMISPTQRAEYITANGEMTEKGKNLFESAVLGKIIDDAELLSTTPKEVLRKLERSVAALARVKAAGGLWDFIPELQDSLRLWKRVDSVRDSLNQIGTAEDSLVDKYLNPGKYKMGTELMKFGEDTVRETPHPTVEALAKLLEQPGKEMKTAVGDYADDAEGKQITLGPPPVPAESFNRHIGSLVKVDVPDDAWGVLRPKEAVSEAKPEEKAPEVQPVVEPQPEATGKSALPDLEGGVTVGGLENVLQGNKNIAPVAKPLLDAMGTVVKNALKMDLGDFLKKYWADIRTEGAPGEGGMEQATGDVSVWARRAGRKLTITPYGEQLDIFGGAEPQFLLRAKGGDERLVLKSELMKIRDEVPRLKELVDSQGNVTQQDLFGAEAENLFGPGVEEEEPPQGTLFQTEDEKLVEVMAKSKSVGANESDWFAKAKAELFPGKTDLAMSEISKVAARAREMRIAAEGPKVLFQEKQGPWLFKSEQVLQGDKLANVQSGAQWAAFLRNKGVKADELKWMGIDEFLEGKKKVSKQELLDFIHENQLQVTEVAHSELRGKSADEWASEEYDAAYDSLDPAQQAWVDSMMGTREPQTKYSQYTLPGPLSRDTEILTIEGWKRIDAVEVGETVLSREDESGVLEWVPVEAKPQVWADSLYHFENRAVDLMVTDQHAMVVRYKKNHDTHTKAAMRRMSAEEVWKINGCQVPLTGKAIEYPSGQLFGLDAGDVAEFFGWFLAEGSYHQKNGFKNTIEISQSKEYNPEKCARLEKLFDRLGVGWRQSRRGDAYYIGIRKMPKGLSALCHAQGKSRVKFVPKLFYRQPASVISRLLGALILGDGCTSKSSQTIYFSLSERLAGDAQALAVLVGKRGSVYQRASGLYCVGIGSQKWQLLDKAKKEIVPYKDYAFCVTVKNHAIYVRRNGKACFTGNSKSNYTELLITLPKREAGGVSHRDSSGNLVREDGQTFSSSHFDEPNILAHVRFDERTDASGKRVLFIEEVQSDWHQKGKKVGYGDRRAALEAQMKPLADERLRLWSDLKILLRRDDLGGHESITDAALDAARPAGAPGNDYSPETVEAARKWYAVWKPWKDLHEQYLNASEGVPDAPFKTDWHELVMKRMLRWAAEHGYDRVGWVTGEQTADRYDLSKTIQQIGYEPPVEGGVRDQYILTAMTVDGKVVDLGAKTKEQLADTVGKDIAEKIIRGEGEDGGLEESRSSRKILSGLQLKTGGEWAKALYDNAIPNFMRKYGKKWGAGVRDLDIGTAREVVAKWGVRDDGGGGGEVYDLETGRTVMAFDSRQKAMRYAEKNDPNFLSGDNAKSTVHSMDISSEMKKSVMEGQPLFQEKKGATEFLNDGKAVVYLFEKADPSTFLHEFFHTMRRYLDPADQKVLEDWMKIKDGIWSRKDEEQAARAWEYYHRETKPQTLPEKVAVIFKKIQTIMRQIYEQLKGSPLVKPSKEVSALFDRWYGKEMEAPPGEKPVQVLDTKTESKTTKFKFGNTQANIPAGEAAQGLDAARAQIAEEDLAGKGKDVDGNHVTVRYGIKGEDTEGIKDFLAKQPPFEARLGKTDKFPPSESSDGAAVIMAPIEAPALHALNKELAKHGEFTDPTFDYKPHATVAYVKPEAADKYVGMDATDGKTFKIDRIAISDRNGKKEIVRLGTKKPGEKIAPVGELEAPPLSAAERKDLTLKAQGGILPLDTGTLRTKVFPDFSKAAEWAKSNKDKIKGLQIFALKDGRAVADFTAKKENVLFQTEHEREREKAESATKIAALSSRLQHMLSDAERASINRQIRDLKAKQAAPVASMEPPPGQIISLWTPEGERPVEVKREQKETRPARTVPDEAIRLEEPPRLGKPAERPRTSGISQPKPPTGGGVRPAGSREAGRTTVGEPRTTLRDVRPLSIAPVPPRDEAAYSVEDWSNRVEKFKLPDNAPAPTVQISDELARMLMPGQREVAESVLSGLKQHNGYILATTTGTGKTYMGSAVISHLLGDKPDARMLILTPSQSLIHGRDGWIQVAGNFGVEVKPLPVGEMPQEPGVYIKTWAGGIANRDIEDVPWDLVIMDEVQEARKWWTSQRGDMSKTMGENAKKILYTSATPFHTALEIGHMGKLGLWGREGFEQWAAVNGLGVYRDKAGNLAGGKAPLRLEKLRQQLIERGQMINIDRNMEGYSAHFGVVPMDGVTSQGLKNIDEALNLAERYFERSGKKGMIQAVKAQRTTLAKRWLEYQRLPQAIELARKLEKEGWKTIFFSENKKEFTELFDFLKPADDAMGGKISQLMPKFRNTTDVLRENFGEDVAVFAGKHSAAREAEKDAFNDDSKKHLYATYGAGGVGVSMHDKAGDKPRAVIYLGPPWSGIAFDQALGRPWRYGTKSNVRAYFLFSDSQAEMDLVTNKVAPRMESLRAMVSGVNFEDPVVKNLRAVPDNQVGAIDYDHGNAHDAEFDQFTKRRDTSGVSSYAELPIVSSEEAKNKGMQLPGSDGAQDPSVIRLWQDSTEDEVLPQEFEAPELTLGRRVNVELAERFIETGAAPGNAAGRNLKPTERRQTCRRNHGARRVRGIRRSRVGYPAGLYRVGKRHETDRCHPLWGR